MDGVESSGTTLLLVAKEERDGCLINCTWCARYVFFADLLIL